MQASVWRDIPAGSVLVSDPPTFVIGWQYPIPWAPAIVAVDLRYFVSEDTCAWIYLGPISYPAIEGEMAYICGENDPQNIQILYPSTGGHDIPVAGVNCDCPPPISAEIDTWGRVKAMYR